MNRLQRGLGIGLKSVQKNWLPAVVLQMIMLGFGVSYYFHFAFAISFFEFLSEAKREGGILFSFIAGAVAAGIFSEIFRVYFVDNGKWRSEHRVDMFFKFFLMGAVSILTDYFYQLQAIWFGSATDWGTLHHKVAVDMLLYSALFTVPMNCLLFLWKEEGFCWRATARKLTPFTGFLGDRFLPLWVSNICFWLPIVYVIYSMPPLLQMPLNLIAVTIWGILIVTVSNESRT